jgi:hypothetical protein
MLAGTARLWLFHAGLWGLFVNFAAGAAVALTTAMDRGERERVESRFFAPFRA